MKIRAFLNRLKLQDHDDLFFNPYLDSDLLGNLEVYLRTFKKQKGPRVLLVGEAPGYRGCRMTGIPFSSSHLLLTSNHPFIRRLHKKIKLDSDLKESTAKVVWQYLEKSSSVPLFWNAFPFHPHQKDNPQSNRKPNTAEVINGISYLKDIGKIYNINRVAGIGRSGVQAAEKAFPKKDIIYIRHPSYGGKNDFIKGMNKFMP